MADGGQRMIGEQVETNRFGIHLQPIRQLLQFEHSLTVMHQVRWPGKVDQRQIVPGTGHTDGVIDVQSIRVTVVQALHVDVQALPQGLQSIRFQPPGFRVRRASGLPGRT
ncbi:hypothetical protein D3C78_992000 [compost metagenome]